MRINLDGLILRSLTRIFDVAAVTFYFILCCLPVFTIGAAVTAAYTTLIALAGDSCTSVTRSYFDHFRNNFKQATQLWLPMALIGAVVVADIAICWGFGMGLTPVLAVMRGLTVFCTGLYLAMSIYLFTGIGIYHVSHKQAVTNALQWIMKKLPATALLLLIWAGMAAGVILLWFAAVPLIGLGLYWQAKLLRKILELPEVVYAPVEEEIHYD